MGGVKSRRGKIGWGKIGAPTKLELGTTSASACLVVLIKLFFLDSLESK